jgi:hypothetical protein
MAPGTCSHKGVLPWISVNKKVTVPEGKVSIWRVRRSVSTGKATIIIDQGLANVLRKPVTTIEPGESWT